MGPKTGVSIWTPFGTHFGVPLGTPLGHVWAHGDPKGLRSDPKRLTRGFSRWFLRETPKKCRFGTPADKAQVSSRFGESTILHILDGSFLDLILEPFGLRLGGHLGPPVAQEASEGPPRLLEGSKKRTHKTS